MRKPSKKVLRGVLTLLLVAVIGYFFWRALSRNLGALKAVDFAINGWTILAILAFALAVTVSGTIWGRMVSLLSGVKVPEAEAIRVHCSSWLMKYVPGQVGSAVNKVTWAKGFGIPRTLVLITFIYENVFLVVGSLVPTTLVLVLFGTLDLSGNGALLAALASLIPLLLLTNKKVFAWLTNLAGKRFLKREVPSEYFLSSGQAFGYQLWYLIPRVITGIGMVTVAKAMINPAPSTYLPLACAYIVAGAVGILAIFVPSGIGVRESVFVFLAAPFIPVEEAIVLSLAARLWATVADVVVAGVYIVLEALRRRKLKGS